MRAVDNVPVTLIVADHHLNLPLTTK